MAARLAAILLVLLGPAACREPRRSPAQPPHEPRTTPAPLERPRLLEPGLSRVPLDRLCVSSGELRRSADARWLNTEPTFRATAPGSGGHHAAVEFRYLGSTARTRRLASGRELEQIGLKLLSRDSCNVVYAMWRFRESPALIASVKVNPASRRHRDCANHGYHGLEPFYRAGVAPPAPGSVHRLAARLEQGTLVVSVDEHPVLRAVVAGLPLPSAGASGLRSDNARFELLGFETDVRDAALRRALPGCAAGRCCE